MMPPPKVVPLDPKLLSEEELLLSEPDEAEDEEDELEEEELKKDELPELLLEDEFPPEAPTPARVVAVRG